jgi:hypothetical protein
VRGTSLRLFEGANWNDYEKNQLNDGQSPTSTSDPVVESVVNLPPVQISYTELPIRTM